MLELKETEHSYYCSDSNYYVNGYENFGRCDYDNWEEFKENWLDRDLTIDHDYNHCFRFDIKKQYDSDLDEEIEGKYSLNLYFILQRKGIFRPVYIKEILESDMDEINTYLKSCAEYIRDQWSDI